MTIFRKLRTEWTAFSLPNELDPVALTVKVFLHGLEEPLLKFLLTAKEMYTINV